MVQICQVPLIKIVLSLNFVKIIIKKQYRNQVLRIRSLLTSVNVIRSKRNETKCYLLPKRNMRYD